MTAGWAEQGWLPAEVTPSVSGTRTQEGGGDRKGGLRRGGLGGSGEGPQAEGLEQDPEARVWGSQMGNGVCSGQPPTRPPLAGTSCPSVGWDAVSGDPPG